MEEEDKQKNKNSKARNVANYLKLTPLKMLLLALFIISCLVCLSQVGKSIQAPYPFSIKPEGNYNSQYKNYVSTSLIMEGKNASIMIDEGFTRCVILNKNQQVLAITHSDINKDSTVYYQSACVTSDAIYILYVENYSLTDNVKSEKLVKFDLYGFYVDTVWSQDYTDQNEQFRVPRMINLEQDNEGQIYGLLLSAAEDEVFVVKFSDGSYDIVKSFKFNFPNETVINATYNIETDLITLVTDTASLYVNEISGYKEYSLYYDENAFNHYIISNEDNSISPINEEIKFRYAPDVLYFSPFLIFKTLMFWACLLFIIITVLILVIRKIVKLFRSKKFDLLIRISICIVAVAGILGISFYYSFQIFNGDINNKMNLMQYSALNLSSTPNDYAKSKIKSVNNAYDLKKEDYLEFKNYLLEIRQNALESNFALDYTIYKINKPNIENSIRLCSTELKQIYDLNERYISYEKIKGDLETEGNAIYTYTNLRGSYMAAYAIIYDDEESIGIAEVSCNYWLYIYSLIGDALTIFITLSVILIVLITFFAELVAAVRSKKLKEKYNKLRIKHPEIAYNRMFAFLINFLSSFNSVLLVLIAKDIIDASNLENEAVMIALPTFFLSFGIFWGQPVFDFLAKRFNVKTIMVGCCALMFATYVMCFHAVTINNFLYFNIATLLSSLGTGIVTSIRAYMPVLAPDEKIRYELNSGSTKTWISSGIVSVAVAGFISDMFGSASIYILALLPVLLILLIGIFLMPSNTKYRLEKHGKKEPRMINRSFKFFFNPAFLIYAFGLIVVCVLCHGYRNFMFPLFTNDAGISKVMISNIVVIANFIAYAFNNQLNNMVKRMDFWELGIVSTIIAGILYISFAVNSEVAWACVVIIFVTFIIRIMSTVNGMLWPRLCQACKYPMSTANTVILCYTNIISAVQGFVLSALMVLGMINACICIGVFMLIIGVLFAVITYNTALRKNKIN